MVFFYWYSLISSVFLRCKININISIYFFLIHLALETRALDTRFENNLKFHLEKQTCLIKKKPKHSTICPLCSKEVFWSRQYKALRWEGCLKTRLFGDFFVQWLFTLVTVNRIQIILNNWRSCWITLAVCLQTCGSN